MGISIDKSMVMTSEEWKKKGNLIPVFNKEIFTIDTGDFHENCLVILHGYLTSSYNYYKVLPELSKHYRVILLDFIGFGFSNKLEKQYFTIIDQADYVLELCRLLGLNNISLLAHDYGTSIAQEIIARKNYSLIDITIEKYIFCNGNMPIEHSDFSIYQNKMKNVISKKFISMLASFGIYKKTIQNIFYDGGKVTDAEIKELWFQLELNNGRHIINFVSNYLEENKIFWHRWAKALCETKVPLKLIWGKQDPIITEYIPKEIAKKIKGSEILWIENSGHFPMLESPKEWLEAILKA